jgi:predicted nucleotidyltransferase
MKEAIQIVQSWKDTLADKYGSRLKGVILSGSLARGDADAASDSDLLVLLESPFDYSVELRRIVTILYPIQLESGRLISAKPVTIDDYEVGSSSL